MYQEIIYYTDKINIFFNCSTYVVQINKYWISIYYYMYISRYLEYHSYVGIIEMKHISKIIWTFLLEYFTRLAVVISSRVKHAEIVGWTKIGVNQHDVNVWHSLPQVFSGDSSTNGSANSGVQVRTKIVGVCLLISPMSVPFV